MYLMNTDSIPHFLYRTYYDFVVDSMVYLVYLEEYSICTCLRSMSSWQTDVHTYVVKYSATSKYLAGLCHNFFCQTEDVGKQMY